MLQDALDSFSDIFSPPFRRVMAKSLALTAAVLALAWIGLDRLALSLVHVEPPWLATAISFVVGFGLLAGLVFLAAPVSSLVAGFFLDEIAAHVEREIDPSGPQGRSAPVLEAAVFALRFAGLSVLVNLIALVLLFVPGLGIVAWIAANGYLLGREYFELAAMRFRSAAEAREMRARFEPQVYLAGLLIAGFVAVPLLNLFTPLFATTLMARLHKRLS
ncbi:MAG TPA: sulfate transporter family protein [Roseiarcus sp.]|nr:sulfate transporter family protein [Roseiarcus sp.]